MRMRRKFSVCWDYFQISSFGSLMNAPQPGTDQGSSQPTGGFFYSTRKVRSFWRHRKSMLAQELGSPYPFKPILVNSSLLRTRQNAATSQKRLSIQGKYAAYYKPKHCKKTPTLRAVAFGSKTTGNFAQGDQSTILRSAERRHPRKP